MYIVMGQVQENVRYKYLKSHWADVKSVTKKNYKHGGFMCVVKYINNYEIIIKEQQVHISYLVLIISQ